MERVYMFLPAFSWVQLRFLLILLARCLSGCIFRSLAIGIMSVGLGFPFAYSMSVGMGLAYHGVKGPSALFDGTHCLAFQSMHKVLIVIRRREERHTEERRKNERGLSRASG